MIATAEVKSGIFQGDDGNDMTVDGKKYPITIPVANWIRDHKYQPGLGVTFEIKEQNGRRVVTKVYPAPSKQAAGPDPDKLKKHGFGEPTPGPAPEAKSVEVPPARAPDELFTDEEVAAMKEKAAAAKAAQPTGIEKICADTKARNAAQQQGEVPCTSPAPPAAEKAMVAQVIPAHPAPKNYSPDEMLLLRNMIAKGCTEPEFKLLMYMANTYGLDPLLKQIWAVKRSDNAPALIFAGRDGMLAIAHRSGHFDGMHSEVVYEGTGKDKKPASAWCEIWRNDMTHSFKVEVPFAEYNTGYSVWKTNPSAMILKVAESVCLRKAFSVSGLYSPEEIDTGVQ